ncbi:MAG: twin-arginine translocation protein TatA/E family subunit [Frankiales bacterium]|jgi:sec-independent protein translocase protein TatA|nr:twin-arginine translocation protein TatA/E family subunit [Frankiales bacterium]MCW2707856.1 twin-arginine translocation protein TatA/E family subunit [Frankiales bacterium]
MLEFFEKGPVLIVLLVGIVIFGSSRLPGAARSLGQSMRILKAEAKGLKDDDKDATGTDGHAPAPKQLPESSTDSTADQN